MGEVGTASQSLVAKQLGRSIESRRALSLLFCHYNEIRAKNVALLLLYTVKGIIIMF